MLKTSTKKKQPMNGALKYKTPLLTKENIEFKESKLMSIILLRENL